jgi:hypothetical protein
MVMDKDSVCNEDRVKYEDNGIKQGQGKVLFLL